MYYLPILYFYFTYTIFSPFINSSQILNYTFYKISNLTCKSKLKKFDLNNTVGNKLLVYTVNDESSKKIINKLQDQIKINTNKIQSDYVIINTCNSISFILFLS